MTRKELIIHLLDGELNDEVFVNTKEGKKKVKCVCSCESSVNEPRYYSEILLDN